MKLTYVIKSDPDGGYIVFCPEFGIITDGDTIEEAIMMIKDATYETLSTRRPEDIPESEDVEGEFIEAGEFEIPI